MNSSERCGTWWAVLCAVGVGWAGVAGAASLTVQVDKPGARVSPMLWGIFFEDINLSADGGLWAELVRNRSFEDSDRPEHWTLVRREGGEGAMTVDTERPDGPPLRTRNLRSLRLDIAKAGGGALVGAANEGYWGMAVREGESYVLNFRARCGGGFSGPLSVILEDREGRALARGSAAGLGEDWRSFRVDMRADAGDPRARLVLGAEQAGTVWLDFVSLFPKKTWKDHGWRPDIAETLAALKPAFVRFPGGCWVEGDTMREAYRWKETIGDPAERRTQWNLWQYWATHGIGYHEYLQLCEDLGAEPLFVINCGMSHKENVPIDQMGPLVQDALDAIEYANGPVTSPWGALRARSGHPEPFNLKYVEIGNENGGPAYHERWPLFHRAIKARHPDIQLIANVWGGYPTNELPEIIDEHYYNNPEFFMLQADRYDTYDRKGPKVYVGEYAVTQDCGQGNLRGAVGEAAFMCGMERNGDVVAMASYAPLLVNMNHRRWNPDLINYDSSRVFGLPSYYVQKMFSEHRGDVVLPVELDSPGTAAREAGGAVGVGTWRTRAEFKDLRVTRGEEVLFSSDFTTDTKGWKFLGDGEWRVVDGALRQEKLEENVRAIAGDRAWKDYTLSLKARKLGGEEGFLILFHADDENRKSWWNIGGWGNARHAVEIGGIVGNEVQGGVETGRWYDIRVEVSGPVIKCFLDGRLVHDIRYPELRSLYASATRAEATGEVILKVVNAAPAALEVEVRLAGWSRIEGPAKAVVLTSGDPADENSLDSPRKVAPEEQEVTWAGPAFRHAFPGNSVTVLRCRGE